MAQTHRSSLHPSLTGAFARVTRADEHLQALELQVQQSVLPVGAGTTGRFTDITIPAESLSILVGEVVYNLRSALDYLVFELALLDSRLEKAGTQFPIEDKPPKDDRWTTGAHPRLDGVSPRHKQAILSLQPFSGCTWTAELRNLSNPDKHRHLIFVYPFTSTVTSNSSRETVLIYPGAPMPPLLLATSSPALSFSDESPVVTRLRVLVAEVRATLQSFAADFKDDAATSA